MTHAESFSQCASYRNYRRYYIWGIFVLNGNGNMPKQLTYTQFVNKLDKGDLKSLEIQPEQNVYMVSGKLKVVTITHQQFYITMKRLTKKITDTAKTRWSEIYS